MTLYSCTPKVHLDRDRGKWKVTRCCIPLDILGENLTSVLEGDVSFEDLRKELQDQDENHRINSEDIHVDNRGGPIPEGAWQFSMYSTVKPMRQMAGAIPDPRGDFTFGPGEECFAAIEGQIPYDEVLERFPLNYSQFVRAQATFGIGERTVIRRHPELFVIIDSEFPAERGVLIAQLSWDKDVEKSESELRQSGKEGHIDARRCDVGSLLATIECIADRRRQDDEL